MTKAQVELSAHRVRMTDAALDPTWRLNLPFANSSPATFATRCVRSCSAAPPAPAGKTGSFQQSRPPTRCAAPAQWTAPRLTPAATIDSTPCSRVRFTAASRHDSTVMNPLITDHNAIAASNAVDGTAAAPAHQRIAVFPAAMNMTAKARLSTRVPRSVMRNALLIQS